MKLEGVIEIAAPPREVWALMVNPASLASCVPGVRDVRQVDDRTFDGSITAAVGPMEGDFTFTAVLVRSDYPDGLEVEMRGLDSVTKSRLEARVQAAVVAGALAGDPAARPAEAATEPERTTLRYHATVTVKGRLAILGEMVLRATASLMITQVTRCLRARLEPVGAPAEGAAAGDAPGGGAPAKSAPAGAAAPDRPDA